MLFSQLDVGIFYANGFTCSLLKIVPFTIVYFVHANSTFFIRVLWRIRCLNLYIIKMSFFLVILLRTLQFTSAYFSKLFKNKKFIVYNTKLTYQLQEVPLAKITNSLNCVIFCMNNLCFWMQANMFLQKVIIVSLTSSKNAFYYIQERPRFILNVSELDMRTSSMFNRNIPDFVKCILAIFPKHNFRK